MGKLASTRVVDPFVSNIMSGYRRPDATAVNHILPIVDVATEAGKFMDFAADASVIRQNLNRALGDSRKRIDIHVGAGAYSTGEVSIEVPTYDREMKNVPVSQHDNYQSKKDFLAQDTQLLLMEYNVSQVLLTTGNYGTNNTVTLAGAQQWQNSTATIIKNLRDWLWTVALMNGVPLAELGIGIAPKPARALIDSAEGRDRVKYVGKEVTLDALRGWLECKEVVLLNGMYASDFNPEDPTAVSFTTMYDDEVIVYIPITNPTAVDPLAGGIARLEGHPIVTRYRDETKSADISANDDNWGVFWKPANRRIFLAKSVSGLPALF